MVAGKAIRNVESIHSVPCPRAWFISENRYVTNVANLTPQAGEIGFDAVVFVIQNSGAEDANRPLPSCRVLATALQLR